jgi:hypothetical protein
MSRGYPDVRLNDQIRTLFRAGSLGSLPDGQLDIDTLKILMEPKSR